MESNFLVLPKISDIRAARARLNWSQKDLADKCGVSQVTIATTETEKSHPSKELLEKMAKVFMEENIYFHANGGFKVEEKLVKIYEGVDAYSKALKDIYKHCLPDKKEILMLGNDDSRSNDTVNNIHKEYYPLGIPVKYLIAKENDYVLGPVEEYKKIDKELFLSKDVVLIYDDRILFFAEEEGDLEKYKLTKVQIIILKSRGMAEQFKAYFYRLWDKAEKVTKSSTEQILFREK